MAEALVATLLTSLPRVFAVAGTPRDVERVVASLRGMIVARKLRRPLRVQLLRALQLLCKLQSGSCSIREFKVALAATDLIACEQQMQTVHSLEELYGVLGEIHVVSYKQECEDDNMRCEGADDDRREGYHDRCCEGEDDKVKMTGVKSGSSSQASHDTLSCKDSSGSLDNSGQWSEVPDTPDSVFGSPAASLHRRQNYSREELLSFRSCASEPPELPTFVQCLRRSSPPTSSPSASSPSASSPSTSSPSTSSPSSVQTPATRAQRASSFVYDPRSRAVPPPRNNSLSDHLPARKNYDITARNPMVASRYQLSWDGWELAESYPIRRSRADIDRWQHDLFDPNQ